MQIIKAIDNFLNAVTMYRLLLYGLIILSVITLLMAGVGLIPFGVGQLALTLFIATSSGFIGHHFFKKIFHSVTNSESYLITSLIIFFIIAPVSSPKDALITFCAGLIAEASKYLFAVEKKHIFNPVAFSMFVIGLLGFGNSIWWIGSAATLPFVLIIGMLVVRKIRKIDLLLVFIVTALITVTYSNFKNDVAASESVFQTIVSWPLIFLGTIMLTEPLTSPGTRNLYLVYGAIVGLFFGLQFHIGPFFSTPELAVIIGNLFAYAVGPKQKLFLTLKKKTQLAPDIYEFAFENNRRPRFLPGQYLEWTIPEENSDSRGNRRYFTVASSPAETELKLGVKITKERSSSFKKKLSALNKGDRIIASQFSGDFILPNDPEKKLVFIAGGIGITPFRSMIKHLLDTGESRDIVLYYAASNKNEFVYRDIFDKAGAKLGMKTFYLTERLSHRILTENVPDYKIRTYYLSGPNAMVENYRKLLNGVGIKPHQIVTDYFPGF